MDWNRGSIKRNEMCNQFKVTKEDLQPFPGLHKNLAHCNMVHMLWENFCNVYEILPQLQEPLCHTVSVCLTTPFKGKIHHNNCSPKTPLSQLWLSNTNATMDFTSLQKLSIWSEWYISTLPHSQYIAAPYSYLKHIVNWNLVVEPHSNSHGDIECMKDWHSQTW